jgi:hypothetical protein
MLAAQTARAAYARLVLVLLLLRATGGVASLAPPIKSFPLTNSTVIVALAGNEGFQFKLLAVVERLRSMAKGRTGAYRLIAYDLGLDPVEAAALRCATPTLLDELRPFDFAAHPPHVASLGCYAWKPLLLAELRRDFPNNAIVW